MTYHVGFRHRRPLNDGECRILFDSLRRLDRRDLEITILAVLPERTDFLARARTREDGQLRDLGDAAEAAKRKAGNRIIKQTKERFPPFGSESYDRIMRDDDETELVWEQILQSPVTAELCEDPEQWPWLWVPDADHE